VEQKSGPDPAKPGSASNGGTPTPPPAHAPQVVPVQGPFPGAARPNTGSDSEIQSVPDALRERPDSSSELHAVPEPAARPQPSPASSSVELPTADEIDVSGMPDEELMRLCQDGDELAFEELFKRYEGPALSFINRMIGDRSRTEALGQEAFLRIFKEAKSYQYPRSFPTWFYTTVRNLCKNELRWRSRHPTVSIEENLDRSGHSGGEGGNLGDRLKSAGRGPLDEIVGDEMVKKLEGALEGLPELEREILILNRFQNLKYKEIAEIVGVPVGTVRSRIHGALDRLRREIKDYL
jgi:RNA polymerase sigma-70 factor (ECF subfamily)